MIMMKKVLILLSVAAFGSSVLASSSSSGSSSSSSSSSSSPDKPVVDKKGVNTTSEDQTYIDLRACMDNPINEGKTLTYLVLPDPVRYEYEPTPVPLKRDEKGDPILDDKKNTIQDDAAMEVFGKFKRDAFKGEYVPIYNEDVSNIEEVEVVAPYYTHCFFTTVKNMLEDVPEPGPVFLVRKVTESDLRAAFKLLEGLKNLPEPQFLAFYEYALNPSKVEPQESIIKMIEEIAKPHAGNAFNVAGALGESCGSANRVMVTDVSSRIIMVFNHLGSDFLLHGTGIR
jgi:hypothetical protein